MKRQAPRTNATINLEWLFQALPPTAVITIPFGPDTEHRGDEPWIHECIWSDIHFGEIKNGRVHEDPEADTVLIAASRFESKDRARHIAFLEESGWYGEDVAAGHHREAYTLLRRRPNTAPTS